MRILLIALAIAVSPAIALAQNAPEAPKSSQNQGRTDMKAHQENNQQQPQGPTGPLNTTTGGAPAASPQGETPAGMQSAPEGSSKTIVAPPNK